MKHDEKKIEEITREDKRPFGFDADIDQIRWAMEEYAEHMVQQERERCLKLVEEKQFEINIDEYLPKVKEWEKGYDKPFDDGYEQFRKDIIKAINQYQ